MKVRDRGSLMEYVDGMLIIGQSLFVDEIKLAKLTKAAIPVYYNAEYYKDDDDLDTDRVMCSYLSYYYPDEFGLPLAPLDEVYYDYTFNRDRVAGETFSLKEGLFYYTTYGRLLEVRSLEKNLKFIF
jgi:hypothetical protein